MVYCKASSACLVEGLKDIFLRKKFNLNTNSLLMSWHTRNGFLQREELNLSGLNLNNTFPIPRLPHFMLLLISSLYFTSSASAINWFFTNDEYQNLVFTSELLNPDSPVIPTLPTINPTTSNEDLSKQLSAISETEEKLLNLISQEGAYSEKLASAYMSLAKQQEAIGQYSEAIISLENAIASKRRTDGLETPDQLEATDSLIRVYELAGDEEKALDQREYRYHVQQRAFDIGSSARLAAELSWADWQLRSFQAKSVSDPRSINVRGGDTLNDYTLVIDSRTSDIRIVNRRVLTSARSLSEILLQAEPLDLLVGPELQKAIQTYEDILENSDWALPPDQELLILERLAAAETARLTLIKNLLNHKSMAPPRDTLISLRNLTPARRAYADARKQLTKKLETLEKKESSPLDLLLAELQLADLALYMNQRNAAEKHYAVAWSIAKENQLDPDSPWLNQQPLTLIPTLAAHNHTLSTLDYEQVAYTQSGYIDVSMSLRHDGDIRKVKLIAMSENTPKRVQRLLREKLKNSLYRPPIENGKTIQMDNLLVRFYYQY